MKSLKTRTDVRRHEAFTLVELIFTVAIVGIMAGISIYAFTRNWRDERVKAATRESSAWLEEIRRLAIQRAEPCHIQIDQANATFSVTEQMDSCNQPSEAGDDIAGFSPRTSIQNSQQLIICATDLDGYDPVSINLPCSGNPTGNIQTIFTPRGSVTRGILLKLHMSEASMDRCIAVMAPLGQIRSGRTNSNGVCNFETAF